MLQILGRINGEIQRRIDAGEDLKPPPKTNLAGPEYFGLNCASIQEQIESLDRENRCAEYWLGKEVCTSYQPLPVATVLFGGGPEARAL